MKSYEKLDWKLIAAIEPNSVSHNLDFETLQNLIRNISTCNIENEPDIEIDSSFAKVFKLSQNITKYLLSVQDCLVQQVKNISEEIEKEKKEKVKLENDIEDKFKKKIFKLKSELQQKEELLAFQNNILKSKKVQKNVAQPKSSGAISINSEGNPFFPCNTCNKMFSSMHYLQLHIARRHPQVPVTELFPSKLTANNNLENFDQSQILKDLSKELEAIKEASIKSYSRLQNLQQRISTDPIQSSEKQVEAIAEQMEIQTKLSQSVDQVLSFIHQTIPAVDNSKDKTQTGFSLEKQISDLKLKLESRDDENVRLQRRLREAEQQIKEYQMGNDELMSRVKKDEVIKRQLKEEFDLKLELLKEEQKTENKWQFEKLQNSIMHEMKLMHIKQLETDRNLEDIKRMRLPGNVLGKLEDDTDDHIARISYQSLREIPKEEVKAATSDGKKEERQLQTTAKVETFENQEEVKPSENLIPRKESGKDSTNERASHVSQMSARPFSESTKENLKNSLKSSEFSKKSFRDSAVSMLKHKGKSFSEEPSFGAIEMRFDVEQGSPEVKLYPQVVMKPIKQHTTESEAAPFVLSESSLDSKQIEDNYSQMPNMEEIRSMVDKELEQRMAYYGLEKNSSEITAQKYMEIIQLMNEEVSRLSPDIQEQYLALKLSLEKDLESAGKILIDKNDQCTDSTEPKKVIDKKGLRSGSKINLNPSLQFRESQSLPSQPKPSWSNQIKKSSSALQKATSKASTGSNKGNINYNAADKHSTINNNNTEEEGDTDDDNYDVSLTTISESDIQKTTNPDVAESNNFDAKAKSTRKTLKELPAPKKLGVRNSVEDALRKSVSPTSSIWSSAEDDSPHVDDLYSLDSDT